MIENLLLSLLIVPLIGCFFVLSARKNEHNAFYVCVFTLLCNIGIVLLLLSFISHTETLPLYKFRWLSDEHMAMMFGTDMLSALLILGIYLAVLISLIGLTDNQRRNKLEIINIMYFMWNITGLMVARDMISFYIFFSGMLLPIYMLLGASNDIKRPSMLNLFFVFNFGGILCLLMAVVSVYNFYHENVLLQNISLEKMPPKTAIYVWSTACLAFITRIPIWPFHYWISSISASIKNPSTYIISNMMALTGLVGFLNFWSLDPPDEVSDIIPFIVVFGLLTMCLTALIGLAHKDFIRKLFSYATVYNIFFGLAIIILPEKYKTNMVYSLFIFLIVNASLATLDLITAQKSRALHDKQQNILIEMPRLARLFVFFVFIAAGLPISSMFWNNFVLISALFYRSFTVGVWCIAAISVIGITLLYELYPMFNYGSNINKRDDLTDISERKQAAFMMVVVILFLSLFDPLWFVF